MNSEKVGRGWRNIKVSSLFVFVSIFFSFLFLAGTSAFAAHDATVIIDPTIANCGALPSTFVVNIANTGGVDSYGIYNVKIYKAMTNIIELSCGDAPVGWTSYGLQFGSYCEYVTDPSGAHTIVSGTSLDFTFDATIYQEDCTSTFRVSTLDNEAIVGSGQGEEKDHYLDLLVDCVDPVIIKTMSGGQTYGPCPPGEDETCWMRQDTTIHVYATDHKDGDLKSPSIDICTLEEDDACNLGIDYCDWSYTVDGVPHASGTEYPNDNEGEGEDEIYFDIVFDEDSFHNLTVICYDIAGNVVVDTEYFRVDDTDPETTKTLGLPQYILGDVEWINTSTPITLNMVDPDPTGENCNIGIDKTLYLDTLVDFSFCYEPELKCRPVVHAPDTECVMDVEERCEVTDDKGTPGWIHCVENGIIGCPLVVGGEATATGLDGALSPMWRVYDGTPIYKNEESCHILQYYSIDELGNTEEIQTNCFFVEDQLPTVRADTGTPKLACDDEDPSNCNWWIQDHVTPIKLSCEDLGDHPSGEKSIEYRWTLDGVWPESNPLGEWLTYSTPIIFEEDSVHALEYRCTDNLGQTKVGPGKIYRVDSVAPEIEKIMTGVVETEWIGDCPPEAGSDDICYVKQETGVLVYVTDPDPTGMGCNVGLYEDGCSYEVRWFNNPDDVLSYEVVDSGIFSDKTRIEFHEDSRHDLVINCVDKLGNTMVEDVETFLVDGIAPETTKTYDDASIVDGMYRWITSAMPITMTATDNKVGVKSISYRVTQMLDVSDADCVETCEYTGSGDFKVVEDEIAQFNIGEDSCHLIEFQSADKFDNIETLNRQCVFVDNMAPDGIKEVGEPSIPGEKESVTIHKEVTTGVLAVADPEIYFLADTTGSMSAVISNVKSDMTTILGSVEAKFGAGDYKDFPYDSYAYNNGQSITDDESLVTAAINSMSASGGSDGSEGQLYALHRIAQNDAGFSTDSSKIIVWFGDAPAHDAVCSAISGEGSDITEASVITELTDAGIVVIAISTTTGYFSGGMDDDPTTSAYDYSGYCTIGGTSGQATRIAAATGGVHLTGVSASEIKDAIIDAIGTVTGTTDVVPDASDCVAAGLEVSFVPAKHVDVGSSETVTFEETIGLDDVLVTPETEIVCDIHFRSGVMGGIIATERVYVDSTATPTSPPAGSGTVTPEIVETNLGSGDGIDWWVTTETLIKLSCVDAYPHPVGHEIISWRFSNWVGGFDGTPTYSDWYSELYEGEPVEVYFPEDCWHDLEFYCEDALGNIGDVDTEYFIVETVPPVITKTIEGPQYGDCPPAEEGDVCYIDNATSIHVSVYDPDPHPVGGVTCDWSYVLLDDPYVSGGESDVPVPFVIKFPEESMHKLTIVCRDALGNTATDTEIFEVDHTPPITTKTYEGPQYNEEGSAYPKWISSETEITLSVEDAGPHKSGIKETSYRVTLVDDENCWDQELCQDVEGALEYTAYAAPFNIPEESCHLIEYYSVDNVDKTETINKQCVFVDNSAPEPVKTVGEPNDLWNGLTNGMYSIYYPDLEDRCNNESSDNPIDCWKVTLLTPITMECFDDDQEHPVPEKEICYQITWDGDDVTEERYCTEEGLEMVDGWCCGKSAGTTLFFGEETEHNLKFYCVDVLGNSNEDNVDDEMFKVEGTAFEIELNKKWNLISVPFVMLEDSIEEVFEDVADTVDSVWTYDPEAPEGEEWSVYTPGSAPDTLHEMIPGWGYWVYSGEDSTLLIGGSLFSPGMTPPAKNMVAGWNLIGYWGTEGRTGYYGPDPVVPYMYEGKPAHCELDSLGASLWDKEFSSLWSYWEPYNGVPEYYPYYQWMPFSQGDQMDPGAGYWVYTHSDGDYIVPTVECSGWY